MTTFSEAGLPHPDSSPKVIKPKAKPNLVHQRIVGGLIETAPVSWTKKALSKNDDGTEVVTESKVTHQALRYPLAQNVSEANVNRAAKGLIK